ncbi:TPA: hypothetical protein HA238_05535 [Candidatus Micrarchaeota archaeon]|nr:hypothetical protein [Candidatus Micrarchaeota archaeon]
MNPEKQAEHIRRLTSDYLRAKSELENAKKHIDKILHTKSWQITAPLRKFHAFVRLTAPKFKPGTIFKYFNKHQTSRADISNEKPLMSVIIRVETLDEVMLRRTLNTITELPFKNWEIIIESNMQNKYMIDSIVSDYKKHFINRIAAFYSQHANPDLHP